MLKIGQFSMKLWRLPFLWDRLWLVVVSLMHFSLERVDLIRFECMSDVSIALIVHLICLFSSSMAGSDCCLEHGRFTGRSRQYGFISSAFCSTQ